MNKATISTKAIIVVISIAFCLLALVRGALGSNIDPTDKYAWSKNVGWINFAPIHGGVTLYADHLEGYAWAEGVGWIRLGSYAGGGAHTYRNTSATDYGVNVDAAGALSGYAWSKNVGWINFAPTHGGVSVDRRSGSFDGYAWAESVGWIHFKGTAPAAYNVAAQLPDLALAKAIALDTVAPGDAITYTLTFSNAGSGPATGVVITDVVSARHISALGFRSAGAAITPTGALSYTWQVADLAPGQGGMITITGVVSQGLAAGLFTNTAQIATTALDADAHDNLAWVTVTVALTNTPPAFTSVPVTTGTVGIPYTYNVTADDADGDALVITATTQPGWLTLTDHGNDTAVLSGTPTIADTYPVVLQVSDGEASDTQVFTITVEAAPPANTPPTISNIGNQATEMATPVTVTFAISDAETAPGSLWLSAASGNPALLPVANVVFGGSGVSRRATLTPVAGMTGTAMIIFTVSDGDLQASDSFVLAVGANTPPAFTSVPVTTGTVGVPYTYNVTADDVDGDALTITAMTKPGWLTLTDHGDSTATLSGTPTTADTYDVVLRVSDGQASAPQAFAITVGAITTCVPLTGIDIIGSTDGYTGQRYTFTAEPAPPDASAPLTYTWTPTPGSGQGTASAAYTWPTPGTKVITLTADNCGNSAVVTTHTITIRARPSTEPGGDAYEPDDVCSDARFIFADGAVQIHTFHDVGDEDWVAFHATQGITYVVEARVPPTSTADLMLEVYDTCAPDDAKFGDEETFSPDIRFVFKPPASGVYYLRLFNYITTTYGADTAYHLSVQALQDIVPSGAVILVASRHRAGDHLQDNIYHVTEALYAFATADGGCTADQVVYMAPEDRPNATALATKVALRETIEWAAAHVSADQSLTLYMFDHGRADGFYLDGVAGEVLSPLELDGWLDQLEAAVPGVRVNVIIEAGYSGSFIAPPKLVSQEDRMVIASTSDESVAYASDDGAVFSDAFLNALVQGRNLRSAFDEGVWAVAQGPSGPLPQQQQVPWLDDDGDGQPNEPGEDGRLAAQRTLACAVAPPQENWPPHIEEAEVRHLTGNLGKIWAKAQDDHGVKWMWTMVYPPSWKPDRPGEEIITAPTSLPLQASGGGYGGDYLFSEIGMYRLVFHANDDAGLLARPHELKVPIGGPYVEPAHSGRLEIPVGTYTATVEVPAGAVTATTTFTYAGFTDPTGLPDLSGLAFAGRGFTLDAYQYAALLDSLILHKPVTITMRYSDADVAGLAEDSLGLYYEAGGTWRDDGIAVVERDADRNQLIVTATHLTRFALFGPRAAPTDHFVYLPLVLRQ